MEHFHKIDTLRVENKVLVPFVILSCSYDSIPAIGEICDGNVMARESQSLVDH